MARHPPTVEYEPFVDEHVVAEFLEIKPRRVLEMARKSLVPAHPLGDKRKTLRFKISEIDAHFSASNDRAHGGAIRLVPPVTKERKRLGYQRLRQNLCSVVDAVWSKLSPSISGCMRRDSEGRKAPFPGFLTEEADTNGRQRCFLLHTINSSEVLSLATE